MEIEVLGNKDTRSGFGEGLAELGRKNPNVVALCADLIGFNSQERLTISQRDEFTTKFVSR
jgi:transketolase C-terminal domain/subunit